MEEKSFQNTLNHYLVFKLGQEEFAIETKNVTEILEVPTFTKIPRSPEYMKGVINLKGSILPVIDTHIKFQMPAMELTIDSCIIVLNVVIDGEQVRLGALVDEVKEVIEIGSDQIGPSPSLGAGYNQEFVEGIAKVDGNFILLLNLGKVFSLTDNDAVKSDKQTERLTA